jgi:hypothetical protein
MRKIKKENKIQTIVELELPIFLVNGLKEENFIGKGSKIVKKKIFSYFLETYLFFGIFPSGFS